eukprot:gene16256-7638_t
MEGVCSEIPLSNISSYKANCIACATFSIVFSVPTVLLNVALIIAILKSSERKEPYQMLVQNLAFTDLLTGVIAMPNNSAVFIYVASSKTPCSFAVVTFAIQYFLGVVSLVIVTIIALERYVFVFKPYMHSSLLTSRAMAVISILVWLIAIAFLFVSRVIKNIKLLLAMRVCIGCVLSALIILCYTKILLRARKVRRQIEAEAERFGHQRLTDKDRSLLLIGGFIIISFFVCYAPFFSKYFFIIFEVEGHVLKYSICWEWLLVMLNSLVNPVISCIFHSPIRRTILSFLVCGRNCKC